MTTKAFDNVPPCSYGDGVPAFAGQYGARYIDTTTDIEYWYNGGAWKPMGGGSGANGLPYLSYGNRWLVQAPAGSGNYGYDIEIYGGNNFNYGGDVILKGGTGTNYGGNVYINASNGPYADIVLTPGGAVIKSYLKISNLPLAPGPANSIWVDAGAGNVLKRS